MSTLLKTFAALAFIIFTFFAMFNDDYMSYFGILALLFLIMAYGEQKDKEE